MGDNKGSHSKNLCPIFEDNSMVGHGQSKDASAPESQEKAVRQVRNVLILKFREEGYTVSMVRF